MKNNVEYLEKLKNSVRTVFGQTLDSPTDYEKLSVDIHTKTGELISVSTLKRLFGYIKPSTVPRPSTLSVLARYVGYAGWSDFCAAQKEVKTCKSPKKAGHHDTIIYTVIAILSITIGWFTWKYSQRHTENSIEGQSTAVAASVVEETNEQKYERLLNSFIALAEDKCDSVRSCQSKMDIISYKELVDSAYFQIVFTFLKDSIDRQVARTFPNDKVLIARYSNNIFSQCRDVCVELMREIPYDKLVDAYKKN